MSNYPRDVSSPIHESYLVWSSAAASILSSRCLSWMDSFLLSLTGSLLSLARAGLGRDTDLLPAGKQRGD